MIIQYGIVGLEYMLRTIVLLIMNMSMMIMMVRQMLAIIDADMDIFIINKTMVRNIYPKPTIPYWIIIRSPGNTIVHRFYLLFWSGAALTSI